MQAPGTPAISLPPYVAPAFSAGAGPLPSFNLIGAGASVPFTVGQAFPMGVLAPSEKLMGRVKGADVPLQLDVRATWPDGSVFHAILSGVATGGQRMDLLRADARAKGEVAGITQDYIVTIVESGASYTARPRTARAQHIDGPIAKEFSYFEPLVSSEGVKHPYLMALLNVRDYADNAKIDVVIEHCNAYDTQGFYTSPATAATPKPAPIPVQMDITYDLKIEIAGQTRYEKLGVVHYALTRPKYTFWRGAVPDLFVQPDVKYLQDTLAASQYADVKIDEAWLARMAAAIKGADFAPFGRGGFMAGMATTGGRPEIGMMPAEYAAFVISGDRRAYDYLIAQADVSGSWPMHRRDHSAGPAAGRPLDVIHWPRATILGNLGDANNALTGKNEKLPRENSACPLSPEESHQPAMAYLPYLLTGDQYYLDELHFWNNFNLIAPNCVYRQLHKGNIASGQVRGQAWNLRTMAQCAAITPDDHPYKAAANYFLDNSLDSWVRSHATPPPVPQVVPPIGKHYTAFGASGDGAVYSQPDWDLVGKRTLDDGSSGVAPWQDYFFMAAAMHAYELTQRPQLMKILLWKARFAVDMMNSPLHGGMDAATYSLRVREAKEAPFYTSVDECLTNTFDTVRYAHPVGSAKRLAYLNSIQAQPSLPLLQGQIIGYSDSTAGYAANMQPALAAAVNVGVPGAKEAWAKFAARPRQPNYGAGPQFNIVPRGLAVSVDVPQPDPEPQDPPPTPAKPDPIKPDPIKPGPAPAPAPVPVASVSIASERFVAGAEYVTYATTLSGQILAVQIVIAK